MNCLKSFEWGRAEEYLYDPGYCVNRIIIFPGKKMESRKHHLRAEVFIVAEGAGVITLADNEFCIKDYAVVDVPRHCTYSIENTSEYKPLVLIETQLGICDDNDLELVLGERVEN